MLEMLHSAVEKYFDNDWEQYFECVKGYYRLWEGTATKEDYESDLDYEGYASYFTLDNVISEVRHGLGAEAKMYIDEHQIIENWINANGIPDEYKHYVWEIYNDTICRLLNDE